MRRFLVLIAVLAALAALVAPAAAQTPTPDAGQHNGACFSGDGFEVAGSGCNIDVRSGGGLLVRSGATATFSNTPTFTGLKLGSTGTSLTYLAVGSAASVGNGSVITHGLGVTPTFLVPMVSGGYFSTTVLYLNAVTATIAAPAGSSGTVMWLAVK
jgi:hypothetical protein